MVFGYAFLDLTEEQKLRRRHLLDSYALAAQLSAVFIVLLLQARFLSSWVVRRLLPTRRAPPSSPYLKHERLNGGGSAGLGSLRRFSSQFQWWAGEEFAYGWGTKGQWLGGAIWTCWLGFLCVNQTGQDYFHLTKRFGIVAASQLPFHYLLAAKTAFSPLQILTRSSHEQLNAVHQVLGRIITFFFSLHAAFYLASFIQKGILGERLQERIIILGLTSVVLFNLVGTTALGWIRNWSYRLFYGVHIAVATAVLPLLYFHVHHIRVFIWETAAVYVLHIGLRYIGLRTYEGNIAMVGDTNLIRVNIPLPSSQSARGWQPGQHVYLRVPHHHSVAGSTTANIKELSGLRSNPFTIASLPTLDRKLVLIARSLRGNTKDLANLAHSMSLSSNVESPTMHLKIDGPYGASAWMPDFTGYDSILLVAGGVGATFIVPLWRSICMTRSADGSILADRVRFVWAVKRLAETAWAFPSAEAAAVLPHAPRGVDVYVTRGGGAASSVEATSSTSAGPQAKGLSEAGEAIEMEEREHLMAGEDGRKAPAQGLVVKYQRPNWGEVAAEALNVPEDRVAVLVCGPPGMSAQLRREVGHWAMKERDVFWHAEEFGF